MTRKEFLSYGTVGVAGILASLSLTRCSSSPSSTPMPTPGGTFTSTVANGHSHTFTVNQADVQSPPTAGISGSTSSSSGHTHTFAMSQAQLQQVNSGVAVTITTGVSDSGGAHTHDFSITKWF